jgi:hypothetical protein
VLLEAQGAKKSNKTGVMRKTKRITFVGVKIEMSKREKGTSDPVLMSSSAAL